MKFYQYFSLHVCFKTKIPSLFKFISNFNKFTLRISFSQNDVNMKMCVKECKRQYPCIPTGIRVMACPLCTKHGGFYMYRYLTFPDNSMY